MSRRATRRRGAGAEAAPAARTEEAAASVERGREQLARAARKLTLGSVRATGTAVAVYKRARLTATWEWDLAAKYFHHITQYGSIAAEVLRRPDGDYLRDDGFFIGCWGGTSSAEQDDALEPRLELQEWDAPPSSKTAWRVSYAPAEAITDGTTRLRWTGFVASGEAIVGPDGLLRSVRIDDHGQARGRTVWSSVQVTFTGFPAVLTPVLPEPRCSGSSWPERGSGPLRRGGKGGS